jgi:hypothetical protein
MVRSVRTIAVWCVVYIYVGTFDFNAKRKPMLSLEKHCHDSHAHNYALPARRLRQLRESRVEPKISKFLWQHVNGFRVLRELRLACGFAKSPLSVQVDWSELSRQSREWAFRPLNSLLLSAQLLVRYLAGQSATAAQMPKAKARLEPPKTPIGS